MAFTNLLKMKENCKEIVKKYKKYRKF